MIPKKYILIVTLLCVQQQIKANVQDALTATVLAGGAVYAARQAEKEFKKLKSNKVFIKHKEQLAKGIQDNNLKEIGNGTKGAIKESAKPVLLTAYAFYTGTLALGIFVNLFFEIVR